MKSTVLCFLLTSVALISCQEKKDQFTNWDTYLGDQERTHFSPLEQINIENVDQLELAWTYNTGDGDENSYIQCNPLIIDGVFYGTSPKLKVFALDATSGVELWTYNPFEGTSKKDFVRGILHHEGKIYFVADRYLHCIDAKNGKRVQSFGEGGLLDLTKGLDRDISALSYGWRGALTQYKNLLIMGSMVAESLPAAPGHIRAFDINTGSQKWIFHTIPHPGEEGYDTWEDSTAYRFIGGANNWTGLTVDEKRGIAFVPTGSASYDFYGANRKGANLFANSLIALNAETGERIWHFQAVHHDVWDRDFPAPPTLATIEKDGKSIDVVVQITKSGHVYMFERETGESIFPIEEISYPQTDLPGEETWPTQPLPSLPPAFSRQKLTVDDLNPYTRDTAELRNRFNALRSNGQFVPPSEQGTIIYPGLDGGGEWGGPAFDPTNGMLYVNANEMAWIIKMIKVQSDNTNDPLAKGLAIYQAYCMNCHGAQFEGSTFHGNVPSLNGLNERLSEEQVVNKIKNGLGTMPSFSFLSEAEVNSVTNYILSNDKKIESATSQNPGDLEYRMEGYKRFLDIDGYPGVKPPWGTLNAINLSEGTIEWKVVLGEFDELTEKGIPQTGAENYGGPIVTAGGLIFIGATSDGYFRAFNKESGEEVWKYKLPASGLATPATYQVNGVQYVTIAAAGGKDTKDWGDAYVTFRLKK